MSGSRTHGSAVRMIVSHDTMTPATMGALMSERDVLLAIRRGWRVVLHNGKDVTPRWQDMLTRTLPRV